MIGANRQTDWPERLSELVIASADREFAWGVFDCSQFCIDAEIAITGDTRFWDYHRNYKTQRGAVWKLKQKGFDDLWDLLNSRLDVLENAKLAQRGDVIGHYTEDGESLGILIGDRFACVGKPKGIVFKPLSEAVCAWRL